MAVNYTEEQVAVMIEKYSNNPTRETVEFLAQEMDKSIKSIIGKLSREGVYKKTVYKTKTGEDNPPQPPWEGSSSGRDDGAGGPQSRPWQLRC